MTDYTCRNCGEVCDPDYVERMPPPKLDVLVARCRFCGQIQAFEIPEPPAHSERGRERFDEYIKRWREENP